jgi:hypothetical protein
VTQRERAWLVFREIIEQHAREAPARRALEAVFAEEESRRVSAEDVLAEMLVEGEGGDLEGARVIENATKDKAHGNSAD